MVGMLRDEYTVSALLLAWNKISFNDGRKLTFIFNYWNEAEDTT